MRRRKASSNLSNSARKWQFLGRIRIPSTQAQLLMNAVHLLLQSQIFPMKEFEDWEQSVSKNWTDLRIFVQGAYAHCLVAVNLGSAAVQNGYVTQNKFHILGEDDNEFKDADSTGTTATHTAAAATMNSGITAPTVPADVVMAINTLSANQMTMFNQVAPLAQQMVAFSLGGSRPAWQTAAPFHVPFVPQKGRTFQVPPVHAVLVPMMPTFHGGGFTGGGFSPGGFLQGHGGRSTSRHCTGRGRGGWGRTPFADHMTGHGANVPFSGGSQFVPQQGGGQQQMNPPHSNITKKYNNWNACYSCGFDVEDGHFLSTCPTHWFPQQSIHPRKCAGVPQLQPPCLHKGDPQDTVADAGCKLLTGRGGENCI
jgi:hypothetical protein